MKANLHTTPIAGFTSVNVEERKGLGVKAGDTVKVHLKIKEKAKGAKGVEKTRIQVFEGMVIATKHGAEPGATFTVRKVSNGVGIERIFPLYSPVIDKIEIAKRAKVRRSKLYHIREKVAKEIKRQMRKTVLLGTSTTSDAEYQEQLKKELEEAEAADTEEQAAADTAETEAQLAEEEPIVEVAEEETPAEAETEEPATEEDAGEEESEEKKD